MKKKIKLDEIKINAPFKVPEVYFDELQNKILAKIEEKPEPKAKEFKPKHNWKKLSIAAAACLLLVSGLYYQINNKPITKDKPITENEIVINQVTNEQMLQYIENENFELADLTETIEFTSGDFEDIYFENIETGESEINELKEEI
jgi:hypothetical protein